MTTRETRNKNNSAVKSRFMALLMAAFIMNAAFMKETFAHDITGAHRVFRDTLVSAFTVKTKSPKARRDSIRSESTNTIAFFLPPDPDNVTPGPGMIDTSGSSRVRMAMKLYMDSLIIGPKANGSLKKAKNNFNKETFQPNPAKNFSFEAFRRVILLLAP